MQGLVSLKLGSKLVRNHSNNSQSLHSICPKSPLSLLRINPSHLHRCSPINLPHHFFSDFSIASLSWRLQNSLTEKIYRFFSNPLLIKQLFLNTLLKGTSTGFADCRFGRFGFLRVGLPKRSLQLNLPFDSTLRGCSFCVVVCKVLRWKPAAVPLFEIQRSTLWGALWIHSGQFLNMDNKAVEQPEHSESVTVADGKMKRKKLKGKRAVVRWLKFLRWKKKKEYKRMTEEEKILYKLRKARKKEERLVEAFKKIEPKESSETTHDPEILTPEEHFYFLKMGIKCKNYVPVGRRGIYQGVILNMHLHWKKHQTLKVVVKTFSPEEVNEIAAELARLSGGIVLDIQEDNTIIMYRGKNYSQPPTEIMSPRTTLSRKKALDKSKYRDGLRAVRKYIPRLEQDLELLRAKAENKANITEETGSTGIDSVYSGSISSPQLESSDKLRALMAGNNDYPNESDPETESGIGSDSEDLSDIFETDSENEEKTERPLYLEEFEKFPAQTEGEIEDFEEHLRQVSADSKKADEELRDLDEVDRMFLQAASLLKKKK